MTAVLAPWITVAAGVDAAAALLHLAIGLWLAGARFGGGWHGGR